MADFVSLWVAPVAPAPPPPAAQSVETVEASTPEPVVDMEALLLQARKEGQEQGRRQAEAALAPLREELAKEQELLQVLSQELLTARQVELESLREEVAEIVLLVARRVVGDALALHPDALRQVVLGAISSVPGDEPVRVRVAEADVERVSGWLAALPRFQVEGDPSVEGGCHVESRHGSVEATVEQAFLALEGATRAWVEEG